MPRKSRLKDQEDTLPKNIGECLKFIVTSGDYNDVGIHLCKAMYYKEDEPYNEWVQTWLIKCISECFKKEPVKMDIMFAYFALLPGFSLHTPIGDRLMLYAKNSGYLDKYPVDSKRSFEEIENDSDDNRKNKELGGIKGKITRMQRDCLKRLEDYIYGIGTATDASAENHIADLGEYGKLKVINGKTIYCPFPVKLNVPKLIKSPLADDTELSALPEMINSVDEEVTVTEDLRQLLTEHNSEAGEQKSDSIDDSEKTSNALIPNDGKVVIVPPSQESQAGADPPPLMPNQNSDENDKKDRIVNNRIKKEWIWIGAILCVIIITLCITVLLFTKTLAEMHGQFEAHVSSCYMRLDFSRNNYEAPSIISGNTIYYGDGINNTPIE